MFNHTLMHLDLIMLEIWFNKEYVNGTKYLQSGEIATVMFVY